MKVNNDKSYLLVFENVRAAAKIDSNYIESKKETSVIRYNDQL